MNEQGALIVFVYTARMAIPIKNARVSVFDVSNQNLIAFRLTNDEGITELIKFNTPDESLSLSPQDSVIPYAECNVKVEHPDYQSILIEKVQIFSNQESIQNVELIPNRDFSDSTKTVTTFPIPPQSL